MTYVTSDIHGYSLDSFLRMLEKAGFGDSDTLYVIGDVIDRNGDGGIAMLRWMMSRPNVEFILGNHEAMMLSCSFLFDEITDDSIQKLTSEQLHLLMRWMRNGCEPTLSSLRMLKVRAPETLNDLLDYLRDAPLYRTVSVCGRYFVLVHGGYEHFSPERKLSDYQPDELLWYRPYAEEKFFPDVMTILGHTPTGYRFGEEGKMFRTETWIDIDIGAAGGKAPMLLRLEDLKEFYADEDSGGPA